MLSIYPDFLQIQGTDERPEIKHEEGNSASSTFEEFHHRRKWQDKNCQNQDLQDVRMDRMGVTIRRSLLGE